MEASTFLKNFSILAEAPNGIKKLREMILQLAVQGKLVEQDPNDEPASVLLKKIKAEKQRLISEGKINKTKALPVNHGNVEAYSLQPGWEWSFLSDVCEISPRNICDDTTEASFVEMANVPKDYRQDVISVVRAWSEIKKGFTHFADGDVALAKITPCFQNGKAAVLRHLKNGIGAGTTELHVVRPIKGMIYPNYILVFLKSPKFVSEGIQKMTGSAGQKRVPKDYVAFTPFPLPPLAEQKRIVAKVDQLMGLCDELEAQQEAKRATSLQLNDSCLDALLTARKPPEFARHWNRIQKNFNLLYNNPNNIKKLRQSILQLAVMGKLVKQDPNDEPASELLEKIKAEKERLIAEGKIKKSKVANFNEDSFETLRLPLQWESVPFGVITFNRDGDRVPVSREHRESRKGPYDYYGASGVIDSIDDYIFDKPLLLIGEDGANLINRSTPIAFIAEGKYWVNNHAHVLDGISLSFLRYLELFINATDLKPYVTGTAQPKMNQAKMNSIPILIPPESEQMRIVAKVDQLMGLCDKLEEQLTKQESTATELADALVERLVVPQS